MSTTTEVRQPDMYDGVDHVCAWISPDGAVEIPWDQMERIERTYMNAGWYARTGIHPEWFGIKVTTFAPDFQHPGIGFVEAKGDMNLHTLWRVIVDAMSASTDIPDWGVEDL
jgi:hypothetical protein